MQMLGLHVFLGTLHRYNDFYIYIYNCIFYPLTLILNLPLTENILYDLKACFLMGTKNVPTILSP